jgi:biopolymer transport protein ExbB/TolQ
MDLRVLTSLAGMGPFIGLLGTVYGTHMAFESLGTRPPAEAARLGISYAVGAVLASLVVAQVAALACRPRKNR